MIREITSHKLNGLNDALKITVLDEPGDGGANHRYHITTVAAPPPIDGSTSVADLKKAQAMLRAVTDIRFQKGPIKEAGVNGISNESLLAIVIDRLQSFQAGAYACRENHEALVKLEEAMTLLQKRTRDRLARGVEGTSQK